MSERNEKLFRKFAEATGRSVKDARDEWDATPKGRKRCALRRDWLAFIRESEK